MSTVIDESKVYSVEVDDGGQTVEVTPYTSTVEVVDDVTVEVLDASATIELQANQNTVVEVPGRYQVLVSEAPPAGTGYGGFYTMGELQTLLQGQIDSGWLDSLLTADLNDLSTLINRSLGLDNLALLDDLGTLEGNIHGWTESQFTSLYARVTKIDGGGDYTGDTLVTAWSQISQTVKDINSLVARVTVMDDPVYGLVERNWSRILQESDRITFDVAEDIAYVDGRVDSHSTQINQTATTVGLHATRLTELDDPAAPGTKSIVKAFADISVNAGEISLYVNQLNTTTGVANQAALDISAHGIRLQATESAVGSDDLRLIALETMTADRWSVSVTEDPAGTPYATGIELVLYPDWENGKNYYDGTASPYLVDYVYWIDNGTPKISKCKLSHIAASGNHPASDTTHTYWEDSTFTGYKTAFRIYADAFEFYTPSGSANPFLYNSETDEIVIANHIQAQLPSAEKLMFQATFDEGSGLIVHDATANNNDADLSAESWAAFGMTGNSCFQGGSVSAVFGNGSPLDELGDATNCPAFTVCLWHQHAHGNGVRTLFTKWDATGLAGFRCYYRPLVYEYPIVEVGDGVANQSYSFTDLVLGDDNDMDWHFWVFEFDCAGDLKVWRDNVQSSVVPDLSTYFATGFASSVADFTMAAGLTGYADQLAIYRGKLTAKERQGLFMYPGGVPQNPSWESIMGNVMEADGKFSVNEKLLWQVRWPGINTTYLKVKAALEAKSLHTISPYSTRYTTLNTAYTALHEFLYQSPHLVFTDINDTPNTNLTTTDFSVGRGDLSDLYEAYNDALAACINDLAYYTEWSELAGTVPAGVDNAQQGWSQLQGGATLAFDANGLYLKGTGSYIVMGYPGGTDGGAIFTRDKTHYNTDVNGFFMGWDTNINKYALGIGSPTAGGMTWDGSKLSISSGSSIAGTDITSIENEATKGATWGTDINNRPIITNLRETFEYSAESELLANWDSVSGSGEVSFQSGGEAGGKYLRVGNNSGNDQRHLIWKESIPLDPNKLYRLTARFRRISGSGTISVGLGGRNAADDTWIDIDGSNTNGVSQHMYCIRLGAPTSSWAEVSGYIKGADGTSEINGIHYDPLSPGKMYSGTKYVRPILIVNYNGQAGQFEIDHVTLEEVHDLANLGFTGDPDADNTTAKLTTGVTLSGGGITVGSGCQIHSDGKTAYNSSTAGFFLGWDTTPTPDAYCLGIGDGSNFLTWDGAALTFKGAIKGGSKTSATDTTNTGIYIADTGNLCLGSSGNYLQWNGSTLIVSGDLKTHPSVGSSQQGVHLSKTDNQMYFWGSDGSTIRQMAAIGINSVGGSYVTFKSGTSDSTNTRLAYHAYSYSQYCNFSLAVAHDCAWLECGGANTAVTARTSSGVGILGYSSSSTGTGIGVEGNSQSTSGYDFYSSGNGSNYLPFTGTHEGLAPKNFNAEFGDILVDVDIVVKKNLSNCICSHAITTTAQQKGVIGVYTSITDLPALTVKMDDDEYEAYKKLKDDAKPRPKKKIKQCKVAVFNKPKGLTDEDVILYENMRNQYSLITFNAVGEGQINVCDEGGNIEIGDYICTSNTPGKGMKQDDDLTHNYTVAKAREAVDWTQEPKKTKTIACIYLCG